MKINPRTLSIVAAVALLLPFAVMLVSQMLIWIIPGCDPNPYATEGCVIAGQEVGARLVQGVLGGMFVTVISGLFVAAPLFITAWVWTLIRRRSAGKVA